MPDIEKKFNTISDVTFIIKTFERVYCIKRLVKSIIKKYPETNILIADDSEISCKEFFARKYADYNITVYEIKKDCGLSYGRNFLVDKVATKYFVLLDDDFVFDYATDIEKGLQLLKNKRLDILGGYIRNYAIVDRPIDVLKVFAQELLKRYQSVNYIGSLNFDQSSKTLYANYIRQEFPDYADTDITLNFFIAKTKTICEKNMWDEELKLHEHTAFFLKAKNNNLRVGFSNIISVKHKPIQLKKYRSFRNRNFVKVFMKLYGIDKIVATFDNGGTVVTEYEKLEG